MGWVNDELARIRKTKKQEEERLKVQREKDHVARTKLPDLWKKLVEIINSDAVELEQAVRGVKLHVNATEDALTVTRPTDQDPLLQLVLDRNELTIKYTGIINGTFRVGLSEWDDPQLCDGGTPMPLPKASEAMLKPIVQLFA
jgi:hypothetical protein